jgi:predicted O-methyltransferase YrrM
MKIKFKTYWRKTSLKNKNDGNFLLRHVERFKPKNFLEVGVFHGVTSRNVCELLHSLHGENFKFTGIDLFLNDAKVLIDEHAPKTTFSNPLKTLYYNFIIKSDPYSVKSVNKLLKKFEKNISLIKGNSQDVLKKINLDEIDYVFLDGGHKYETVKNDLENLTQVVNNKGTILCDDYNLTYAPGVKKAIDEYVLDKNYDLKILNSRFAEIIKKSHNS